MKTLIYWNIWQRRVSLIWWSVASFGLIFINMIFYPSFRDQAEELQKSFENLPDAAVQLFGGSTDFFSAVGFLNSQIFFLMLPMFLAILAIGLGSSLLAKEEQNTTLETLLSRPITRARLLLSKGIAGVTIVFFVTVICYVTTIVVAKLVDLDVSSLRILLATFACFLLVLSFGAITFLVTTLDKISRGASIGVGVFVALGGYLIDSLAGTVEWLEIPAKIFPFHYYDSEAILYGNFSVGNATVLVAIVIVCGLISWWSFSRRDIG